MSERGYGGEVPRGADGNRMCDGCARECKQGATCVVVSCPKRLPVAGATKEGAGR